MIKSGDSRVLHIIPFLLIMPFFCQFASGKIIYVDDDAAGANDGSNWADAYVHLQDALADANDSEKPVEIRVAAGKYVPYVLDHEKVIREEDLEVSFQLISNVALLGGYAGLEGQDPNARDIAGNTTILSGNIANYYNISPKPWETTVLKSYNVVSGSEVDANAVLDGFTISGAYYTNMVNFFGNPTISNCVFNGRSDYYCRGIKNRKSNPTLINCVFKWHEEQENGAGMYNNASDPTLINCIFYDNSTRQNGGGIYNDNQSSPTLIDCSFTRNMASSINRHDGICCGGGVYNNSSDPNFINCTFSQNHADYEGGGMYNRGGSATLTICTFESNDSLFSDGGGIYSVGSVLTVTNCSFTENIVGWSNRPASGGGIYNESESLTLVGCIFSGNSADYGGGLYNDDENLRSYNLIIENSIFNGNSAMTGGGLYSGSYNLTIENSIFSGNWVTSHGGGIRNTSTNSWLNNCTFSMNLALSIVDGGGIYNETSSHNLVRQGLLLKNCIFRDSNIIADKDNTDITYYYCNIEGSDLEGVGNIDADPCFVNPGYWVDKNDSNKIVEPNDPNAIWIVGDYHLMSQFGRWDPNDSNWVQDDVTSPCINAGDPTSLVGMEPMPNGGRINMGAYGGTSEASMSPHDVNNIPYFAYNPMPFNGAVDVDVSSRLTWTAGFDAVSHDVYLGTDFNDVNTATLTYDPNHVYMGRYDTNDCNIGTLDYKETYYWRVDEVDSLGIKTIGNLWTFTTKPRPTRPPKRYCFTSKTLVWIAGTLIPISQVGLSQSVDCIDGSSVIKKVQKHEGTFTCYDVLLDSGNCISIADNHYFMVESGQWLSLRSLRAGTKLKTAKGSVKIVKTVKRPKPYTGTVFNIKVAGSDQYMVGKDGVIVRDY